MARFLCTTCRFLVDTGEVPAGPDGAVPLGADWACPVCGAGADQLEPLDEKKVMAENCTRWGG